MPDLDCLILGFYEQPFPEYVEMLRTMGEQSGAYRDLALAFIDCDGIPMRALDALGRYHLGRDGRRPAPFHNADFLWPVVAYLTTYLRRRGFDIDYVNLPGLEADRLRDRLSRGARAVAITTTLYVSPQPIVELVERVRQQNEEALIVAGGPYVFNQAQSLGREDLSLLLDYVGCDIYVLCQEGEATLAALLRALRNGEPLDGVPNLAFRNRDGSFTYTPAAAESNDLDENIIDYAPFGPELQSGCLSIRTAKSCPFACAFCGFPERAGAYRYLDVAAVERQLDAVADTGRVTALTFLDDTFNVPKRRFKDILRMIIRKRYPFRWNAFYRADQGDDEAIDLMAESGCEGVFLGVESGSDAMLQRMNKHARRKHYLRAIPRLRQAGISTYASLIVGYPGETDETVRETLDLIDTAAPEYYRAQLWYADPVTPVWRERAAYGIEGAGFNWTHRTMTAEQACAWIESLFVEVTSSEWLPQFGFEQWSTFYLARRGMSRQQVRRFVHCFNAVVRDRLVSGGARPDPRLVDDLRASCQFDRREGAAVAAVGPDSVAGNREGENEREWTRPSP